MAMRCTLSDSSKRLWKPPNGRLLRIASVRPTQLSTPLRRSNVGFVFDDFLSLKLLSSVGKFGTKRLALHSMTWALIKYVQLTRSSIHCYLLVNQSLQHFFRSPFHNQLLWADANFGQYWNATES